MVVVVVVATAAAAAVVVVLLVEEGEGEEVREEGQPGRRNRESNDAMVPEPCWTAQPRLQEQHSIVMT